MQFCPDECMYIYDRFQSAHKKEQNNFTFFNVSLPTWKLYHKNIKLVFTTIEK